MTPTSAARTRILLAEDHALVRHGLRLILDAENDLEVVAEAADGAVAVEMVQLQNIDLAILDIAMPRMTGLQAAREISRKAPEVKILMLSMYDNEQYFLEALRAGAAGYVLKSVADRDLVAACRSVRSGRQFVHAGAKTALVEEYLRRDRTGERLPATVLTAREEEVLKMIAEGNTSKDIARVLTISAKTVDRHRSNLLQKLAMHDRLELTRYAIRTGLVEP